MSNPLVRQHLEAFAATLATDMGATLVEGEEPYITVAVDFRQALEIEVAPPEAAQQALDEKEPPLAFQLVSRSWDETHACDHEYVHAVLRPELVVAAVREQMRILEAEAAREAAFLED